MSLFSRDERDRSQGQTLVEFALVAPFLFLLLIAIFEAGRYVLFVETLNNATREGARYAIVNGENAPCPSGPLPPPDSECDPAGANVKQAVADAALSLAAMGDLFVDDPMWVDKWDFTPPERGDVRDVDYIGGYAQRGDYVTVFVDYSYDPIFRSVFGVGIVPSITISAEASLVVNN